MADLALTFDEIPSDWRVPGTYAEVKPVYTRSGLVAFPARAIIVGQMLATGTATAGRVYPLTRAEQAVAWFGAGSVAADMAAAWLANNSTTPVDIVGLSDPAGGVKASGTFVFSGAPSQAGTQAVMIAGQRLPLTVAASDTATTLATALAALINATSGLPVTAAAATGTVTLTARHAGLCGNDIDLQINPLWSDATPAGLAVAVTAMSGGAGEVSLTSLISTIASDWYTDMVCSFAATANLSALTVETARRFRAMAKLDMRVTVGLRAQYAAAAAVGATLNSPFLVVMPTSLSPSPPWAWAAATGAIEAFQLANDPARQLRSLVLNGVVAPGPKARFTETERDLLLRDGCSTWTVDADGTVRLERVISTYQTSALGVADTAWLDIMDSAVCSRIRYDWASYFALSYPRHKLASDESPAAIAGGDVVTARMAHASWAARCLLYAQRGWIDEHERTVAESAFARSDSDRNRLEARLRIRRMGNLMVFAASLEFEA